MSEDARRVGGPLSPIGHALVSSQRRHLISRGRDIGDALETSSESGGVARATDNRTSCEAHSSNVLALHPHVLAISPGPGGLSEGRGFIDRTLSAAGFDAGTRYQVTVATNEAVSNAMEHGVPCADGHIHLAATVEYGSFVFSVRDCGEFEHAAAPTPDPVAERGRGFAFMNLLMDDVRLEASSGKTVLRLAKRLPGTPPAPREADPAVADHNLRVVHELFDAFAARDMARTLELVDRGVMIEPLSTPVVGAVRTSGCGAFYAISGTWIRRGMSSWWRSAMLAPRVSTQ